MITTITIYARPTGSDSGGDGSSGTPYETFRRAVQDVPAIIPPGVRYVVDITDITEVLPDDYTLPVWKAPKIFEDDESDPFFLLSTAVAIRATPRLVALIPPSDATIDQSDIASPVDNDPVTGYDPVTGLITITLLVARPSWGGGARGALAGKFVIGETCQQHAVIAESTPTTLLISTTSRLTGPLRIMEPSAHLSGMGTGLWGALNAFNCDSLSFDGIKITTTDCTVGAVGLACAGSGLCVAQLCELQSPDIEGRSTSENRLVRNWIYGSPILVGDFFLNQGFMQDCSGGAVVGNPTVFEVRRMIFDGCDPLEAQGYLVRVSAPAAVPVMAIGSTLIRNGLGDGVVFHGSCGQLVDVDIYGCAGNGITANLGHGVLDLQKVATSGAPNGGLGVRVDDGMFVKVDAATCGSATPLTGVSGDMKVGVLPMRRWIYFTGVAPIKNEFDLVGQNACATYQSSGSRLYQSSP